MEILATSVSEAARSLNLGRTRVYQLINEGVLDTVKVGRRRLVKMDSLRRVLDDGAPPQKQA